MTQHDETIRLRHMLKAAREAVQVSKGLSRQDLAEQRLVELALTKLVETVGEGLPALIPLLERTLGERS